jgi:spore coat-associated protein N
VIRRRAVVPRRLGDTGPEGHTDARGMPHSIVSRLLATVAVLSALAVGGVLITPALADTGSAQRIERCSLSMHNSVTGPIVSLEGMTIGEARTGSVTITNSGSLPGTYTLSKTFAGSAALAHATRLTIASSGKTIYTGRLGSLARLDLGRFAPGQSRTFAFRETLPSTGSGRGDNGLQGSAANVTFAWSAVAAE